MEEKLYFKPSNYGKAKKKQQTEPKVDKRSEKTRRALKLFCLSLFLLTIILIIIWFLHGRTTTSGQYPENLKTETLDCVSTELTYAKVNSIDSKEKELHLQLTFNGEEYLNSINLRYSLIFPNKPDAIRAEAISHAQFNSALQSSGYSSEKFNNKFTIIDNRLTLSLYAKTSDIDVYTSDYLLIDKDNLPNTLDEYRKTYEALGLTCTSSLDK